MLRNLKDRVRPHRGADRPAAAGSRQADSCLSGRTLAAAATIAAMLICAVPSGPVLAQSAEPSGPVGSIAPAPLPPLPLPGLVGTASAAPDADMPVRALVVARDRAVLSAEVTARIQRMAFRPGETFQQDDILVELDCALYEAERAIAAAERSAAARQLEASRKLFELRSIGQLDLAIAEAALEKADATLRRAGVSTRRCTLRAPFAGRVATWHAQPFETVDAGVPLIEVFGLDPLEAEAIVPSQWFALLAPGVPVEVRVEETGHAHAAEVARLGAGVDPGSRTLRVHLRFLTPPEDLRPGMSGFARFALKAAP